MSTTDKIAAGVAAREAEDPAATPEPMRSVTLEDLAVNSDPQLEVLVGLEGFDSSNLDAIAASAQSKADTIKQHIDAGLKELERSERSIRDRIAGLGLTSKGDAERIISKDISDDRTRVTAISKDARATAMDQLRDEYKKADLLAKFWRTPQQVLSRLSLGHERRSVYQQQIAHANVAEVRNLCELAVATKNVPLAGALLMRLDELPAKARPYSSQAFSTAVVGDVMKKALLAIERTRVAYQATVQANQAYTMGRRPTPSSRIATGLANDRIAQLAKAVS
ncbi:MAG: hypothetical protein IT548_18035 [Alphaproteobacteria bacterium]|nr:hypothetical protein [Alphaproteobacteria bacterium]